jgi:PAS domain S-box-containing protein
MYNRLGGGRLRSVGTWKAPPGYDPEDNPEGHICYDVIRRGEGRPLVVRNLPETRYAETDPNVAANGLRTYIGHPVTCKEDCIGSLCVVYQEDFEPDGAQLTLLGILASAIGTEERRRKVLEDLRGNEQRLRLLFEMAPDAYFLTDLKGALLDGNRAAEAMSGYAREELIAKNILHIHLAPAMQLPKIAAILAKNALGQAAGPEEFTLIRKDGRQVYIEIRTHPVTMAGRTCVLAIARDITARKEIETQLLAYQEQLRTLTSQVSSAEERERRRLAADLHDHIGQALAVAKIKLGRARREAGNSPLSGLLDDVHDLVGQTIKDARSLAFRLSPPLLHELGFVEAVEWLAEQFGAEHGLTVEVRNEGCPQALNGDFAEMLFRGVRELLMNVIKHARAGKAMVAVGCDGPHVRVEVGDDGGGFDTAGLSPAGCGTGFGLFSLRERLDHLGGRLEVESAPGRGTRVTMVAPLGGGEAAGGGH